MIFTNIKLKRWPPNWWTGLIRKDIKLSLLIAERLKHEMKVLGGQMCGGTLLDLWAGTTVIITLIILWKNCFLFIKIIAMLCFCYSKKIEAATLFNNFSFINLMEYSMLEHLFC